MRVLYYEEGNGFLGISLDRDLDIFILHVDLVSWSVSEYKRYLNIFRFYLGILKEVGIDEVYSMCDSEKEVKFNKLFGFQETGFEATDVNGVVSKILRLEL
jgi:hypothetical protein